MSKKSQQILNDSEKKFTFMSYVPFLKKIFKKIWSCVLTTF